jgi:hypothetical protein
MTKTIVATIRINQNRPASVAALGPKVFKTEGLFSAQALKRSEDRSMAATMTTQRFVPRNKGILTAATPKKKFEPDSWAILISF